jgi:FKBP-type peptidyl-prolyl cis-trans isomerase FkpA
LQEEIILKRVFALVFAAAIVAGCASQPDSKPAAAAAAPSKAACPSPPSELVTQDLAPGTGQAVKFRSAVLVRYTGWLYDGCAKDFKGAQFDSNAESPVPFGVMVGVGRVIQGWDEGLIGLKEKGKRRLVIPPGKAYGSRDLGKIPPNSTLVFDVELVQIVPTPG